MDRRKFLTGAGTIGTASVVGGVALRESSATRARADGPLAAAAAPASGQARTVTAARKQLMDGLSLGYLPGSAGLFASGALERAMRANAAGLRWTRWNPALPTQRNQSALNSLFKVSSLVDVSIGALRRPAAKRSLKSLDVTAHFALDETPYFAPFHAWRYEAAASAGMSRSTQPIAFVARIPDHVALEVSYALDAASLAANVGTAGALNLPIGAGVSASGLATGLYVITAPTPETGAPPDIDAFVFSGDPHAPLADPSGRPIDFEYLALAIRPVAL